MVCLLGRAEYIWNCEWKRLATHWLLCDNWVHLMMITPHDNVVFLCSQTLPMAISTSGWHCIALVTKGPALVPSFDWHGRNVWRRTGRTTAQTWGVWWSWVRLPALGWRETWRSVGRWAPPSESSQFTDYNLGMKQHIVVNFPITFRRISTCQSMVSNGLP